MEALHKEEAEKSELEKAKRKIRDLEKKLAVAEEKARIKLSVKEMLKAGPEPAQLAEKLAKAENKIAGLENHNKLLEAKAKNFAKRLEAAEDDLKLYDELKSVFRRIFPRGVSMGPFAPPSDVPSEVVVSQDVPKVTVTVKKPVVETDESNWRGRLILLIADGFFDQPRKLTAVREELRRRYGVLPRADRTSTELVELCRMHLLERFQEKKSWTYRVYSGAKEKIKTKEVEA